MLFRSREGFGKGGAFDRGVDERVKNDKKYQNNKQYILDKFEQIRYTNGKLPEMFDTLEFLNLQYFKRDSYICDRMSGRPC